MVRGRDYFSDSNVIQVIHDNGRGDGSQRYTTVIFSQATGDSVTYNLIASPKLGSYISNDIPIQDGNYYFEIRNGSNVLRRHLLRVDSSLIARDNLVAEQVNEIRGDTAQISQEVAGLSDQLIRILGQVVNISKLGSARPPSYYGGDGNPNASNAIMNMLNKIDENIEIIMEMFVEIMSDEEN